MFYEGIRKLYPKIQKINKKLACYIQLMRPFTLVAPLIAGFLGILIERSYHNQLFEFKLLDIILAPIAIALFQAFGQIINQITDIAIDEINKSYRALPRHLVKTEEALMLAVFCAFSAFWFAFHRSLMFGTLMTLTFLFAVGYSVEPLRVKRRNQWLSLFWMSFSRGLLPFLATWSVYGDIFTETLPWKMGIVGFFWVFAFQSTKDFPDTIGDFVNNIPTLTTRYGKERAFNIMLALSPLPFLSGLLLWFGEKPWMYITLGNLVFAVFILMTTREEISTDKLENSVSWIGFYLGLGFLYLLFFLTTLVGG